MRGYSTKYAVLWLALGVCLLATREGFAAAAPAAPAEIFTTTSPDAEAETESTSERTAHRNQRLLVTTCSVLALFVVIRLALVWKITHDRKKMAKSTLTEGQI